MLFICLLLPSALGASDPYDSELPGVMVREHVLYFACCAVLIPLAGLVSDFVFHSKWTAKLAASQDLISALALVVFAAVIVPLAIVSALHTVAYNDEISLWQNVLHGDGDSTIALNTLGQLELADKDYTSAEQHFLAALNANPNEVQAADELGAGRRSAEAVRRGGRTLLRSTHPPKK